MAEIKRITLHPLFEDGRIDTDVNLYPKTLLDGIVDRSGNPVEIATKEEVNSKQDTLISGTNIKTVNSQSLLGSGNIQISEGDVNISLNGEIYFPNEGTITLPDLQPKLTAGTGISISDNVISCTAEGTVTDVQVDGISVLDGTVAKIVMPTIPTKTSDLNNDSGFITSSALFGYATETWVGNQGYLKSVSWDIVTDKPSFASVATSGSYNDLIDKPSIPAAQIQSDWNQSDNTKLDFIKNKPTIPVVSYPVTDVKVDGSSVLDGTVAKITLPTIPTNVSSFNNDAGYITSSALSGYATETWVGNQGYLTSVSWSDVSSKPNFATVATSGSYNDLNNKLTAGSGINISSNAISVDSSVVALQTDLPSGSVDINFNGTATGTTAILNNIIVDTTTYTITSTRGTAASGGTTLSLVNTGDMYTWNNKQNALTTASISSGTPVSVIGFDSSDNLVKGVASIVQDLTSNTAFTLDATAWANLKTNHYASISSPTMTGFDISKELVNIKASINSIPYIIKLVKNENYSYSGLFFIEDNASALYELTAYYNGSVIILRCAQVGSFTFSGTYMVTMNFNESGLSDKSYVRVYDGQDTSGALLFEDTTTSATPTQTLKCRSGYLYVSADGYETYISTSVTSGSITTDSSGLFIVSGNGEVLVDIDYDF